MRRLLQTRRGRVFGVVVVAVAAVATTVAATTSFGSYTRNNGESAPAWVGVCDRNKPRHDRVLLAHCARAEGYVGWVKKQGGDPPAEVHFALVGRFGALIVKLGDPRVTRTPRLGEHVRVVGALVRARNGMREIQAWTVE